MFLCELQAKCESARIGVLEKHTSHQSTLFFSFCLSYSVFSQVYKSIFTSPSSAKNLVDEESDTENMAPTKSQKILSNNSVRRNVASKLHLNNNVTPRSVAYSAVQACVYVTVSCVVLCLSVTASSISTCKLRVLGLPYMGFDYNGLYNYVINFFEDTLGPAAKKCAQELLNWWSM